ncbi:MULTISPECIES: TetR/AcrR family transcriptional regulator [Streptomyces]|uniref:HTH-type transcriptional repressor KstR2 n=1 Tax=Streptomyces violaceusniger TaxID=68280 RepID=A0A4D4LIZ4_STRVO|nr:MULTISPECIES: TetR/AcrR family transcriptional regulator [unclassified Streptomyces]MBD3008604.1 TetR family transcriptional regulator [Streptomyces sp. 5-10]GDY58438.1 HTH-type transcriptional repressor KstR2 [Streptomyces violaceusniger]
MATRIVEPEAGPRSKRAAILAAAVDCFGETSFEATKWSTVAERVGIGQTALYHYFESKTHCLLTIMRLELQRSHDKFTEATEDVEDPTEALRAAVRAAYEVSDHEVLQMRILHNHMDLLSGPRKSKREEAERVEARKLVQLVERDWTNLLVRGMSMGVFPLRDAQLLGASVLGLIVSVWRWYRPSGPTPLAEVSELIEGACVRMVAT